MQVDDGASGTVENNDLRSNQVLFFLLLLSSLELSDTKVYEP